MSKRTVVDQKMCDMVKLMMAGKPKLKTVADMLGIGVSTVQRIQAAGYDAGMYKELTEQRKRTEQRKAKEAEEKAHTKIWDEQKTCGVNYEEEQVPGQMEMDLQTEEEGAREMAEYLHCEDAPVKKAEIISFMRLFAGKTEQQIQLMSEVCMKLDKMIDNQAQILRRMDK